jgi:hypothetical protein
MSSSYDRRTFLKSAAGAALIATLTPELILADPYTPFRVARRTAAVVRVTGRVSAAGRGLSGVRISDGTSVVRTDGDGRYELLTSGSAEFVSCSVPAGHRIDTHASGTARFYRAVAPDARGEMSAPFELSPLDVPDREHTMLLLPDPQTQDAWEMARFHEQTVPDVVSTVRDLGAGHVFGIACGDIMYDDLAMYPEYERAVSRMGIPFFQVVGNHDLDFDGESDEATTQTFSRHFGPRYYSFDRGAVRYVVMDDVFYHGAGYIGYVQHDQLRWLEADLADLEPGAPVIMAMHIPAQGTRHLRTGQEQPAIGAAVSNREALYRLLEPFDAHIVCGHTHENDHNYHNGVHEHVSGTVCGAWWSGPICGDGTPNGYSVYEVRDGRISWRYKSTGEASDHQLRAYAPGVDPTTRRDLVANVWNADEGWEVVWYEDGERRGRMARRIGLDPLSQAIHTGDAIPPRRPWVDPYPRYLYYATPSAGARELLVEATDRFGRTYATVAGPLADVRGW